MENYLDNSYEVNDMTVPDFQSRFLNSFLQSILNLERKNMFNLIKKTILTGMFFLFLFVSNSQAGNYIAALQISAPTGLTEIVFQTGLKSKKLCRALNKNFWNGVRTSNPWTKDHEGCLTSMPRGYEPVLHNQPFQFPYLSSEKDRIVVFGLPLNESIRVCEELSLIYQNRLKRPATCIRPKSY